MSIIEVVEKFVKMWYNTFACERQIGICVVEKSDFMKQIDFLRKLRSLKINCKGGELVKYEER